MVHDEYRLDVHNQTLRDVGDIDFGFGRIGTEGISVSSWHRASRKLALKEKWREENE